ncbi:hypothetical protein NH8B_3944 [Pseudogulbenkiania sp. NH8B]|nr:hypothetical protein NH8B_3944 [Pseudogulbenkiania sp. NH8B]
MRLVQNKRCCRGGGLLRSRTAGGPADRAQEQRSHRFPATEETVTDKAGYGLTRCSGQAACRVPGDHPGPGHGKG